MLIYASKFGMPISVEDIGFPEDEVRAQGSKLGFSLLKLRSIIFPAKAFL